MTKLKALIAGAMVCASSALADRIAPADLGMSIWVPSGWKFAYLGGSTDFRYYSLYDTTGTHGGWFQFETYSGAYNSGSTRQWVNEEALVRGYLIEGDCYGTLLSDDTMRVDGAYAREVYGRSATCDSGSTTLLTPMQDRYYRMTGYGDIGWVMSFEGDTSDVDTAANTYLAVLDSVKLDLTFSTIPAVGVKYRHIGAPRSKKLVVERNGVRLNLETNSAPEIQVLDLNGRIVSGRIQSGGSGVWNWRPEGAPPGMVVIRVKSGSTQWTDRAVLPR